MITPRYYGTGIAFLLTICTFSYGAVQDNSTQPLRTKITMSKAQFDRYCANSKNQRAVINIMREELKKIREIGELNDLKKDWTDLGYITDNGDSSDFFTANRKNFDVLWPALHLYKNIKTLLVFKNSIKIWNEDVVNIMREYIVSIKNGTNPYCPQFLADFETFMNDKHTKYLQSNHQSQQPQTPDAQNDDQSPTTEISQLLQLFEIQNEEQSPEQPSAQTANTTVIPTKDEFYASIECSP